MSSPQLEIDLIPSHRVMAMARIAYRGNCHCGRYRYELALPQEIAETTACSCTICVKKGYLWVAPPEGSFRVVRDDGRLVEYSSKALRDKVSRHHRGAPRDRVSRS